MKHKLTRRNFEPQFEQKQRPIPPKSICKNVFCRLMGIVSPSRMMTNSGDEINNYTIGLLKYLCYKRKIKKYQWKRLYKEVRWERKDKEIFDGWYKELEQRLRNEYGR